ncbi:MAG: hypothetical protein JOY77_04440 [Alphaproteobacteria bacterium]|nr:hypothetical protein [Alphaproteobacteria bacterium]
MLALFMLGMFFALGKPGQLQTYFALQSTQELKKFRLELGGQGGYFYQTLVVSIGPFLSFLLFSKARASNDSMLLLIALAMAAAVLAGKIGSFQKIPWVIYLLQLLMLFQVWKRLDFSFGRAALLLICLLAGALAASFVALPELDASQLAEFLVYRFFQVNAEVVYQTFYVYPHYLPHTWGMNIGLIHSIFGSGELSAAHTQVANFFGAEGATFDAFYIADAWVDFGYGGVMVMSLLVGFVVKSVDCFVTSMGKTPLAMALLVSGTYGLFQLMVTSAFTAFLSGGLVLIPLLVLASNGLVNDVARARIQWQR